MALNYAKLFNRRVTPQSRPIPGSTQVANSGGGYSWQVDDWTRFDRFLILGAESGTYYITERDLVKQNHDAIVRCIKLDGVRAVKRIVEISDSGRAPKNDPAVFALALVAAHGSPEAKALAFQNLAKVCRIGTHLFHFAEYVNALRGWGRGLRNAVGRWYLEQEAGKLAYQVVKYQSRRVGSRTHPWSHSDLLRLAHPKAPSAEHEAVFRWILAGAEGLGERAVKRKVNGEDRLATYAPAGKLPETFNSLAALQAEGTPKTMGALVNELHTRLYGIAVEPEVQNSIAEAYIQVRLRVNADPSFVAQQKKLLCDLVLERNALIHQDLAEFDPRSQESCRRWITRLNEQNERILAQHKELQRLLDMTSEAAKHLLADLEGEGNQRAQTHLS